MHVQDVLPRDAIPSIDDPTFGQAYIGEEDDRVIVVEDTPPRAYPVRILSYHEIVNDVLGTGAGSGQPGGAARPETQPVAVTWCPICASAAVYERAVDGRVLTFGTSGKLADDALVLYDRETDSEWSQPLGRAIEGPLEGHELAVVPASVLTWARFRAAYPDGVVLQPVRGGEGDPQGSPRDIYNMTPYERYDAAEGFGLREMRGEGPERAWDRTDIDPKTVVLGVVHDGDAVGYPVPQVRAEGGVVHDSVGGLDLLIVAAEGGIHAFEAPESAFELREGTLYGDGTAWDVATGRSREGRRLDRVPARRLYAFAWQDAHGRDSFYGLG